MVDYFKLLKNKLAIPKNVYNTGNEKMWGEFEKNTGMILPKDYKKLIGTYGTGGNWKFYLVFNSF